MNGQSKVKHAEQSSQSRAVCGMSMKEFEVRGKVDKLEMVYQMHRPGSVFIFLRAVAFGSEHKVQ